ncbi:hypothetical protein [Ornithinimicrobium sp. INDO-MA30-4]|uniref:hypothetical protein n=1 Tax=Ornithinimicrobium sp. INDO-MA30-4 TaxID=2908651 RepID=UPI001F2A4564|nr:hypothetical protein [Ornithinimicrobium sp. INDO-MA30-4]UJH71511.1 hypothetical protein L0A91_07490 [Ornithinimicrobium sp. INDO-MA30-4]
MTLPFRPEDQRLSPLRRMSALESVRSRIGLAIQLNLLSPGEELPPIDQMAEALK